MQENGREHKFKWGRLLIIAACVLVLSAVVFLWVFNYQLLLLSKGFPGRSETVITEGTDASGKEFRMIGN